MVVVTTLGAGTIAPAQMVGVQPVGGGGGDVGSVSSSLWWASTPMEGLGRGVAEVIRAAGAADLAYSKAAVNYAEAQRQFLKNDVDFVNTYFQVRRLNQQFRTQERGPRPTMEDLARFALLGKPQRLSPGDMNAANGQIYWPVILRAQVFAPYRIRLEDYFDQRAKFGGVTPEMYLRLDQTSRAMIEELRRYVADFPPGDYVRAKHFVESLNYESRFPLGQPLATAAVPQGEPPAAQVR
jgi:hypothetical protein